jgi:cytochrome c553
VRIKSSFLVIFALLASFSCSGPHAPDITSLPNSDQKTTNPNGGAANDAAITFDNKISQIFTNRCARCHAAGGALPNWNDYKTAFAKKDRIYDRVVVNQTMPPKDSSTITDDERKIIGQWILAGAPELAAGASIPTSPTGPPSPPPTAPAPPSSPIPPNSPDNSSIQTTLNTCIGCHDRNGNSSSPLFPRIAGQQMNYFETQLKAFRNRTRHDADAKTYMYTVAQDLDDQTIHLLAQYFSQQAPLPGHPNESAPGKSIFENGIPSHAVTACAACHGVDGAGSATAPRLAGQSADYIVKQIKAFQDGEREEAKVMPQMIKGLTEADATAIAEYLKDK